MKHNRLVDIVTFYLKSQSNVRGQNKNVFIVTRLHEIDILVIAQERA